LGYCIENVADLIEVAILANARVSLPSTLQLLALAVDRNSLYQKELRIAVKFPAHTLPLMGVAWFWPAKVATA
jgi:hypothetical protein